MTSLPPGTLFAGYRVLAPYGPGENSYLVEQPRLGRRELLTILPGNGASTEVARRFTARARTLAGLKHVSIAPVQDFGIADDTPWLSTELADGQPLPTQTLTPQEVATVIGQLADALDYAHSQQVVHGALSPTNILITRGPNDSLRHAVLIGFGQNGLTSHAPSPTPADEQRILAIIAYELLTGTMPFEGSPDSAPTPIGRHRPELALLDGPLSTALAANPADRYASGAAFAAALGRAIHQNPTGSPRPPGTPPPQKKPPRTDGRGAWWAPNLVGPGAAAAIGGVLFLIFGVLFAAGIIVGEVFRIYSMYYEIGVDIALSLLFVIVLAIWSRTGARAAIAAGLAFVLFIAQNVVSTGIWAVDGFVDWTYYGSHADNHTVEGLMSWEMANTLATIFAMTAIALGWAIARRRVVASLATALPLLAIAGVANYTLVGGLFNVSYLAIPIVGTLIILLTWAVDSLLAARSPSPPRTY